MKRNLFFYISVLYWVAAVVNAFLGIQRIQSIAKSDAEGNIAMSIFSICMVFALSVFFSVISYRLAKIQKKNMMIYTNNYNVLMEKIKKHKRVIWNDVFDFDAQTWDIICGDYPEHFKANAMKMCNEIYREAEHRHDNCPSGMTFFDD